MPVSTIERPITYNRFIERLKSGEFVSYQPLGTNSFGSHVIVQFSPDHTERVEAFNIIDLNTQTDIEDIKWGRLSRSSLPSGRIIFKSDFTNPVSSMFNDGIGQVWRDTDVTFNNKATLRLDPVGNSNGVATTPNAKEPDIGNSVVCKGRIYNPVPGSGSIPPSYAGVFSWEGWVRFTSLNNDSNCFTIAYIYHRDGTNGYYSKIWFDTTTTANTILLKYADSSYNWKQIASIPVTLTTHTFDPANAASGQDRAGQWVYFRLVTDFTNLKYISAQMANVFVDLSDAPIPIGASTNARSMHFGVDYTARNSTRRFINIAELIAAEMDN